MSQNFDRFRKTIFEKSLSFSPVQATYLGYPGFDHLYRPYDEDLRSEMRAFARDLLHDVDKFQEGAKGGGERRDLLILRKAALHYLVSLDRARPLNWKTSTDLSYLVEAVYVNVIRQSGQKIQWDHLIERLEKLVAALRTHRENLKIGLKEGRRFYRREIEEDCLGMLPSLKGFFHSALPIAAAQSLPPKTCSKILPKLKKASARVLREARSLARFVESKVLPRSTNDAFVLGEDEYEFDLKILLLQQMTAGELFEYGETMVAETEAAMQKLADKIQKSKKESRKTYDRVLHDLKSDFPKGNEDLLISYRDLNERTVAFLRKNPLVDVPKNYRIKIVETPEAFRSTISSAAMIPVPPFLNDVPAHFWVTPADSSMSEKAKQAFLRENHSRPAALNVVVHEALPGHDLQFGEAARKFIANGRKDPSYLVQLQIPGVMSSLGVEGWAHYTEELMAESGFYSPEERLFQLMDAQWRNVRIVVDAGIHTGRMTYSQAVRYFSEKTRMGRITSEREIYRYSKWPLQALTYHLGKKDILELRQAYKRKIGAEKFNLRKFHRKLLDYGTLPVGLFRNEFLSGKRTGL